MFQFRAARFSLPSLMMTGTLFIALAGCNSSAISPQARSPLVPEQWLITTNNNPISEDWLTEFTDPLLPALINEALDGNYLLAQETAVLEESRQSVVTSGADRLPTFALNVDGLRQKTLSDNNSTINENYSASLDLSWELDIWGKLSDTQQQAWLLYQAAEARHTNVQQQLTADTITGWYSVILAKQQLELLQQRLQNVQQNLDIIDRGYKQGINEALDVYLSQDTLYQQRSSTADQQQSAIESVTSLQRLLARYPNGRWEIDSKLPVIDESIPVGIPSELLSRRADIQQAWFTLLAADAGLAVAHKRRFPSLTLVASGGDSSEELNDLLDGGSLAWSILGNITQPLFSGRRLAAAEREAKARVQQAEHQYLNTVYNAFAEVETAISRNAILAQRYENLLASESSSNAAYSLSFQQYQRGLISYTTVLESQRRAFDAQTNVLQLRFQLIQNRIDLFRGLGGGYTHGVSSQGTSNQDTSKASK